MTRPLLRAAIAAGLVIACSDGVQGRGRVQVPVQGQKPSMPGYPAPGAEATVTLLEAGTAPRAQLRLRLRPAQQEQMNVTMHMGMTMSFGETSVPVALPSFTLSANLEVTDLASNGDIAYAITFTKLVVAEGGNEAAAAALEQSAAGITAVKGSGVVSNRGVPRSMSLDTSGVSNPAMKQAFDQMAASLRNLSAPLPEEAVGVGARWEVRLALDTGPMSIFQRTEYQVVSIDGPAVTLKVKVEQTAPPQPIIVPTMPPGAQAALTKMTGTASGTAALRLDALTPTSSMESSSSMSADLAMNGQTQAMTTQVTLKVSIAPGKSDAPSLSQRIAPYEIRAMTRHAIVPAQNTSSSTAT